jgi:hypothetical protein
VGSVVVGIAAFWTFGYLCVSKFEGFHRVVHRLVLNSSRTGAVAKFKQIVGFGQIFNSLTSVYGVKLHSDFQSWFTFLGIFNFDLAEFLLPGNCKQPPPLSHIRTTLVTHQCHPPVSLTNFNEPANV